VIRFLLQRVAGMAGVLLAAITVTFFLVRLAPGGPFTDEKNYPEEAIKRLNEFYGLNDPLPVQYAHYLHNLARGDLGPSFKYPNRTVNQIVAETFPVSLELGSLALVYAILLGLSTGALASMRPNGPLDTASMAVALSGICVPAFVLGPLLVLVFSIHFGLFSAAGWAVAGDRVLPALSLGSVYAAYIARLTRGSMLEVLPQDYVRTARAKGLTPLQVVRRHVLRNAMPPVVSFIGPAAAGLITGSFVVETVFHIPGMGKAFVSAAFNRDYTVILGLVVFYAMVVVVLNAIVDLALLWLDPRIRAREGAQT
jgi:oligopeptide transport system permease protein